MSIGPSNQADGRCGEPRDGHNESAQVVAIQKGPLIVCVRQAPVAVVQAHNSCRQNQRRPVFRTRALLGAWPENGKLAQHGCCFRTMHPAGYGNGHVVPSIRRLGFVDNRISAHNRLGLAVSRQRLKGGVRVHGDCDEPCPQTLHEFWTGSLR